MIIVGCGYTGTRLAKRAHDDGDRTVGIVSSEASRRALEAQGIDARVLDLDAATPGPAPATAGVPVVYLVPPPRDGDTDPRLARFLGTRPEPSRLVYISTSGVYGQRHGASVDEDDAPAPRTGRARRRLDAERQIAHWCGERQIPWVVLRVPGIYGPHRLPLDTLRAGRPLLEPEQAGPGNRIHVDDLVRCVIAATVSPAVNQIFNVGDGNPISHTGFVAALAAALGEDPPPTADAQTVRAAAGERRWSFLSESRRVDVRRMVGVLGVEPVYADPMTGILASLEEEDAASEPG